MSCVQNISDATVDAFARNLVTVMNATTHAFTSLDRVGDCYSHLLVLLDCVLFDIPSHGIHCHIIDVNKYGVNPTKNPSLLSKADRFQVKRLADQCRIGAFAVVKGPHDAAEMSSRLLKMNNWLDLLSTCFLLFKNSIEIYKERASQSQDMLVGVLMKLRYLHELTTNIQFGGNPRIEILRKTISDLLESVKIQCRDNELVTYICTSCLSSMDDVKDLCRTSKCKIFFFF